MRFLSVCSGIEAASVAWLPLEWECAGVAEIEPFCSALLQARYPGVHNYGDFTNIEAGQVGSVDLIVGGTPCQSFSVAGLRGGLGDARGNLALDFLRLVDRVRPAWVVWENVPGVLSSVSHDAPDPCAPPEPVGLERDGTEVEVDDEYDSEELHAFNCFLAGLAELGYGFAYRVLDAQYFGLAQRRNRVFVVGYFGDWRPAAAVLFEWNSLSGNPAPRRKAREEVAGTFGARTSSGGGFGTDFDLGGEGYELAPSLRATGPGNARIGNSRGADCVVPIQSVQAVREKKQNGIGIGEPGDEMFTLTGRDQHAVAALRSDFETEASVVGTLSANGKASGSATQQDAEAGMLVVGGGSCPTVTELHPGLGCRHGDTTAVAFKASHFTRGKDGAPAEVVPPLSSDADKGDQDTLIAFTCKDNGRDAADISPTLRGLQHDGSHANGGGQVAIVFDTTQITSKGNYSNPQAGAPSHPLASGAHPPAVAFNLRGREGGAQAEEADAASLRSPSGGSSRSYIAQVAVRRLTPLECERLQGFPDGYTQITYNGKPAADGPRYRALGNSMAVPCMRWIGERIAAVEKLTGRR